MKGDTVGLLVQVSGVFLEVISPQCLDKRSITASTHCSVEMVLQPREAVAVPTAGQVFGFFFFYSQDSKLLSPYLYYMSCKPPLEQA